MGPLVGSALEEIVRIPDEDYVAYFKRAVKRAKEEKKPFVITIEGRYVDVNPGTPVAFLEGYLAGSK